MPSHFTRLEAVEPFSALPSGAVPALWLYSFWMLSQAPTPTGFSGLCGFTPLVVHKGALLRSGSCWTCMSCNPSFPSS